MKALAYDKYGSPDVLEVRNVAEPVPKKNEVLVRVRAASVNDWDWGLVQGKPFFPNRLMAGLLRPKVIPGCDMAGVVETVGADVTRFKPGDEVYGDLCQCRFGAFAQYVCVRETALAIKSPRMTFQQAAAIPQAGMLALQALFDKRPLQAGQKILINGAGGGVGTFAIQLAKRHDVEVTGVDCASKLSLLRALGYDDVIDYANEDFTRTGATYDLIVDAKTTRSPTDYVRALKPKGVYATVGGMMSKLLQVALFGPPLGRAEGKQLFVVPLKPNRDLAYFNELYEAGQFTPVIDGPYPFSEVRDAFRRFAAAEHQGKIVVSIN